MVISICFQMDELKIIIKIFPICAKTFLRFFSKVSYVATKYS